jgi:hypothetical protein
MIKTVPNQAKVGQFTTLSPPPQAFQKAMLILVHRAMLVGKKTVISLA